MRNQGARVPPAPVTVGRWAVRSAGVRPGTVTLEYAGGSHAGWLRGSNEDAFFVGPPVFVVADGMGGHDAGEVASALVVEEFAALRGASQVEPGDLDACIQRARVAISGLAAQAAQGSRPGSTVMAAAYVLESGHGYWLTAHEGDSRAYLWRGGELRRITRDHSVVQELLDAGQIDEQQAREHPDRHVITRALGEFPGSEPEFCLEPAGVGARLLLCSDGLSAELSATSITHILRDAPDAASAVVDLLGSAVDAGGHDNVTVIVVDLVATEMVGETGPLVDLPVDTLEHALSDTSRRVHEDREDTADAVGERRP